MPLHTHLIVQFLCNWIKLSRKVMTLALAHTVQQAIGKNMHP